MKCKYCGTIYNLEKCPKCGKEPSELIEETPVDEIVDEEEVIIEDEVTLPEEVLDEGGQEEPVEVAEEATEEEFPSSETTAEEPVADEMKRELQTDGEKTLKELVGGFKEESAVTVPDAFMPPPAESFLQKYKLLISLGIVAVVIVVVFIIMLNINKKDKENEEDNTNTNTNTNTNITEPIAISGNVIIREYARELFTYITESEGETPTIKKAMQEVVFQEYVIECGITEYYSWIEDEGSIYLAECIINGSTEKYFYGRKQNKKDYEILYEYGEQIETDNYARIEEEEDLPRAADIQNTTYKGNTIDCEDATISDEGDIYLESCSINGSKERYSYGYYQGPGVARSKNGIITLYAEQDGDHFFAYVEETEGYTEYEIECKTSECYLMSEEWYGISTSIVPIKEKDGQWWTYNYVTRKEIAQFPNTTNAIWVAENFLIIANDKNQEAIYSLADSKITIDYKNIEYYLCDWSSEGCSGEFIVGTERNHYSIINFKTGEVIFRDRYYISFKDGFAYLNSNEHYGLFDLTSKKQLLNNKFYSSLAATSHDGGYALAEENGTLKLLTFDGEVVEEFITIRDELVPTGGGGIYQKDNGEFGVFLVYTSTRDDNCIGFYYDFKDGKFYEEDAPGMCGCGCGY